MFVDVFWTGFFTWTHTLDYGYVIRPTDGGGVNVTSSCESGENGENMRSMGKITEIITMNLSPMIEGGHLEVTICTNSEYDCCNVELLNSNTYGFDTIDKNNALKGVNLGECYLFVLKMTA